MRKMLPRMEPNDGKIRRAEKTEIGMNPHDPGCSSRRKLLSLGVAAGVVTCLDGSKPAHAAEPSDQAVLHEVNVKSFGAVGDAVADDAAAFQRALDAVHKAQAGVVYAPPGRYLFRGTLMVPDGVTLRGSFSCVPSHNGIRDRGQPKPGDVGTALLVTAGRGREDGEPFLTLNTNSSVSGLTIYYPEQVIDGPPVAYPWAMSIRGKKPAPFDLE